VVLELFEKRRVALISVAESLDTGSAAGRLVITIVGAVSQWEREAIGERTRDALRHKRSQGQRVGNIAFGSRIAQTASIWNRNRVSRRPWPRSTSFVAKGLRSVGSPPLLITPLIGRAAERRGV